MVYSNLKFFGSTADDYRFARATDPRLADEYARILQQIDSGTVQEDGSRGVHGLILRYNWVDLPGTKMPNHLIVWNRDKGGASCITYLGLWRP
jgi:hypothetical protein